MKQQIKIARIGAGVLALCLFLAVKGGWAATHVVQFGGSLGFTFLPKDFSAVVGDTVQWNGDFSLHPLSSTTIPANAQSWHNATGTTFKYVIQVPGNYSYQCDVHVGLGMTGTFEASGSVVRNAIAAAKPDRILFEILTMSPEPVATFTVPHAGIVTLEVFDLLGHKIATVVSRMEEQGTHHVLLKAFIPGQGHYFVKLASQGQEIVRTLRVVN